MAQRKHRKMIVLNSTILIVTLNKNSLNTPIKVRDDQADFFFFKEGTICFFIKRRNALYIKTQK